MSRGPERGGAWRCSGSPAPCVHPRISGRARVHVHDGVGPPDPCADACPVHLVVSRRADMIAANGFRRGEHWAWWALLVGNTLSSAIASNEKATQ